MKRKCYPKKKENFMFWGYPIVLGFKSPKSIFKSFDMDFQKNMLGGDSKKKYARGQSMGHASNA